MTPIVSTLADRTTTTRESLLRLKAALWRERSSFEAHWRDLSRFIRPRRERFWISDRNKGDRRNSDIIDSTGVFSARTLQSGLQAGLTSPARPWFRLTTPDSDLSEHGPVKQWLYQVTRKMRHVFVQSNLYNTLPLVYGDMGIYATGAMGVFEDARDTVRSYSYPIGSNQEPGGDERGQWGGPP